MTAGAVQTGVVQALTSGLLYHIDLELVPAQTAAGFAEPLQVPDLHSSRNAAARQRLLATLRGDARIGAVERPRVNIASALTIAAVALVVNALVRDTSAVHIAQRCYAEHNGAAGQDTHGTGAPKARAPGANQCGRFGKSASTSRAGCASPTRVRGLATRTEGQLQGLAAAAQRVGALVAV